MFYDITQEEIRQVALWLENGPDAQMPSDDAVKKLLNMSDALRRRLWDELKGEQRRNASLSRRLERLGKAEQRHWEGGEFESLGYDSVEVAYAVAYAFRERNMRFTMGQLQLVMYMIYASWLFHHKQRICVEHPVRQESGPWFWKVSKKAAVFSNPERWWMTNLQGKNPGLVEVIRRIVAKWGDEREDNLRRDLLKTEPVRNADRTNNGGKWNKEITDGDIFVWKQSLAR